MTTEEILLNATKIIQSVSKKANGKEVKGVHDLYEESVEMAESISVHAEKGEFPEKLFKFRSPNQTAEESKYIKENYKQYTLPEFMDYINTITRPFGDGNWAINYAQDEQVYIDADQTFQRYVEYELPIYGSLEQFIKSILPTLKTIDANGFIAIRPKDIEYTLDENGVAVVDSQSLYEPTIFFFESEGVIDYEHDEWYLFKSEEESLVKTSGGMKEEGNIFELYTRNEIFVFRQYGIKSENTYTTELFFSHNYGRCPVQQMRGVPKLDDNQILWQSPFLFGVDLLDLVAVNSNWLQFSINKCVFPMTIMYGSPCEFKDEHGAMCENGYLHGLTDAGRYDRTCPSCSGSGLKGRLSPLGTLLIKPTTTFSEGETMSSQPPLSYVSPDVTTLDFIEKKIDKDTIKARQILKLRNRNSIVSGQPITATEVFDDAKGMTAFIKPIIDQIFYLYDFCLEHIGWQRYGENFKMPELIYPKSYDFKSSEDYLNDLNNAIKGNMPPAFIQTLLYQYLSSYYGDNQKTTQIFKLAMMADRLFGMSQDEINMKMAKQTIAKWEDILHSSVLNFINELVAMDENFLTLPIDQQVTMLTEKAKNKQLEVEGKLVDELSGIPIAADTTSNVLAQSVGGLTGMIEIVKAVSSGVYDLDAAIALVSQRFGISEEEARKQLGTPAIITSVGQVDTIAKLT